MGKVLKLTVHSVCIHDMVTDMQTAIKALQNGQKKSRKVLSVAAQVYVGSSFEKITYWGHFTNTSCTLKPIVASSFTTAPDKAGRTRAPLEQEEA